MTTAATATRSSCGARSTTSPGRIPRRSGTAELAGLIGWWKLDEKDGRTAADSSGNGHDATVQGNPDWQPTGGKVGGAIALGGDGDFLTIDDESAFDFLGGVTVAAWIKVNAFDKPWQAIVTKGDSAWRIQRNQRNQHARIRLLRPQGPQRQSVRQPLRSQGDQPGRMAPRRRRL